MVDDEQSIVTLLKYNLETAGYIVEVAYDGEEALKRLKKSNLNLLYWTSCYLRRMVLRCVNQFDLTKFSTYFNVNRKDDEFDRVLGLELGADDYMTKPFSPREWLQELRLF